MKSLRVKRLLHATYRSRRWISGALLSMLGLFGLVTLLFNFYVIAPREKNMTSEINNLKISYQALETRVDSLSLALASSEERDAHLYAMILGATPTPSLLQPAEGTNLGQDVYEWNPPHATSSRIHALNEKMDAIARKLMIEKLLQDELAMMNEMRESRLAAIPAIQPLANGSLMAVTSGFGLRHDPIFQDVRKHTGIDFVADAGTPVFATADGQVVEADLRLDGYGNMIVVDHGFGYVTRYAHLKKFIVIPGQRVKRGEQIGLVGSTGFSTASHLHYEVMIHGEPIDPIHYLFLTSNTPKNEKTLLLASEKLQAR